MNSRYIIFADDDADDLELITGFFKQFNSRVQVLEFRNGKEVLNFLGEFSKNGNLPQLIVLDINMPRMNGKETLLAIRDHPYYKNIPVVIYSTSNSASDQQFCKNYKATWVTKPETVDGVKQTARIIAEFCSMNPPDQKQF